MVLRRFFVLFMVHLAIPGFAGLANASMVKAEALAAPTGQVVLTIDGQIGTVNAPAQANFDMDMLRALPSVKFRTSTPWTIGVVEFEGVLIKTILNAVNAKGKTIRAAALNDYVADLDVDTVVSAGAILAYRMNGAEFSVRDKGPLWIMFPFDEKPQLKADPIYPKSVWQLRTMTFRD